MSADKQTRSKNRKSSSDLQRLSSRFMSGLLRSLFLIHKPARFRQAGFVLPTTVLLLLVLTLTTGAMSFRTFSRSSSVIAQRSQQVIESAAAPTIDRAKAKLEYLFSKDLRFPGGIPASDVIASMMLNDGTNGIPEVTDNDPYTFPDETRLDLNKDGTPDNAWLFESDVDGDGITDADEVVVYSVLMDDANNPGTGLVSITDDDDSKKANALVTRNGPINTAEALTGCGAFRAPEEGWQGLDSSTLQKNFQITAFVANRNDVNRTASTLEFQQVRQADKGNKWGAWFKYDLELFPGASRTFFWNGAMHTEGSLLANEKFVARMISSHNSCLYTQDASEITLAETPTFQGQLVSGKVGSNTFSDSDPAEFHLFKGDATEPATSGNGAMLKATGTNKTDSVTTSNSSALGNILLDPLRLLTEGISAHRSSGTGSNWERDPDWEDTDFFDDKRIYNASAKTPYLDDTYRADDRYGPKPVYKEGNEIPAGKTIGEDIPSTNTALTDLDVDNDLYGLDGYWERRSIGQGLRIVVGQRLELGNTFDWTGSSEPLYPPNAGPNASYDPENGTPTNNDYRHEGDTNGDSGDKNDVFTEEIQRRTLYDNLAAVQGAVVYHHQSDGGQLPLACIASTVHPGTLDTIKNSRTFENYPSSTTLRADFLTGNGTDGWEFDFYSSFSSKIVSTEPLGVALRNLAYFAGDPSGGAPSFPPVQATSVVHPYPHQAMWGDFSILRRVLTKLNSGTSYDNLSPADKTTLHSAACTLGMLSYSIDAQVSSGGPTLTTYLQNNSNPNPNTTNSNANALGSAILTTMGLKNNPPSTPTGCIATPGSVAVPGFTSNQPYDYDCRGLVVNKKAIINSLPANSNDQKAARLLSNLGQIQRDRTFGFQPSDSSNFSNYIGKAGSTKYLFKIPIECSPNGNPDIRGVFNSDYGASGNSDGRLGLSVMCIPAGPKYPSLFYLFPESNHSQVGSGVYTQPITEEYVNQPYLIDATNGVNRNVTYKVVGDTTGGIASIKLNPRALANWKLPTPTDVSGSTLDPESMQISTPSGIKAVSLLDKAMFDPRENMSIRVLDFDVNKLSAGTNGTATGADKWISNTDGIVYAFREDAVREDAIVRPKNASTTWSDCNTWDEYNAAYGSVLSSAQRNCRLKAISSYPYLQDPPLKSDTLISTKPVDFYADPDRRPNGFRLVEGVSLNRASNVLSGMTFVSDNVVYIKGDFNLHKSSSATSACANLLEEFDKRLDNDCDGTEDITGGFYNGRTGDNGTPVSARGFNYDKFAEPSVDSWRPIEIVGDAVGILSARFRDGNIQDGFTISRVTSRRSGEPTAAPYNANTSRGNGISSYMNQNRIEGSSTAMPDTLPKFWAHAKSGDITTPIVIDRNGQIIQEAITVAGVITTPRTPYPRESLLQFVDKQNNWNDRRGADAELPSPTNVNAVFISGIVPSQIGQSYGGMHNFPRLMEWWQGINLTISGGFFQLNFSTSATGPYDADAWEPGSTPTAQSDRISYYGAADRTWGYDVGLQYAPAGPIARRFVTIGRPRNEFYRELPVEDPYVLNLRCAEYTPAGGTAQTVDPAVTNCPFP